MMDETRCSKDVWTNDRWPTSHQCSRKAKVFVGGVGYCTQHSPEKETERRTTAERKWNIEREQDNIKWTYRMLGKLVYDHFSQHRTVEMTPEINTKIREIQDAVDKIKVLRPPLDNHKDSVLE